MKPTAAIFDIGNVLLKFDYLRAAWRLVEKNGLVDLPDRRPIVAAQHDFEAGIIDRGTFLATVRPHFKDSGPPDDFVRIWQEIFEENTPMTKVARDLAARMPVFLLSNISDLHVDHIRSTYPVFGIFRDAVYSHEAKLMKPDEAIFWHAAARFGIDPAATIYVDDMPENCETAVRTGYQTFHYDAARHDAFAAWLEQRLS